MKVQPFTELRHVRSIKRLLVDSPRDKLLFVMGVNSGLRVQDLLALRVAAVRGLKLGDRISIKEKKTGKPNVLIANKEILAALEEYFAFAQPEEDGELAPDNTVRYQEGEGLGRRPQSERKLRLSFP